MAENTVLCPFATIEDAGVIDILVNVTTGAGAGAPPPPPPPPHPESPRVKDMQSRKLLSVLFLVIIKFNPKVLLNFEKAADTNMAINIHMVKDGF